MLEGILRDCRSHSRSTKLKKTHSLVVLCGSWRARVPFPVEQCTAHPAGWTHLGRGVEYVCRISDWPLSPLDWGSLLRLLESGNGADSSIWRELSELPLSETLWCIWDDKMEKRKNAERLFNVGEEFFQQENVSLSGGHKANRRFRAKRELSVIRFINVA